MNVNIINSRFISCCALKMLNNEQLYTVHTCVFWLVISHWWRRRWTWDASHTDILIFSFWVNSTRTFRMRSNRIPHSSLYSVSTCTYIYGFFEVTNLLVHVEKESLKTFFLASTDLIDTIFSLFAYKKNLTVGNVECIYMGFCLTANMSLMRISRTIEWLSYIDFRGFFLLLLLFLTSDFLKISPALLHLLKVCKNTFFTELYKKTLDDPLYT